MALRADMDALEVEYEFEDFGWYQKKAKGLLFRFGKRNEALGCTSLIHCNDFRADEAGMATAIEAFASYVLNLD